MKLKTVQPFWFPNGAQEINDHDFYAEKLSPYVCKPIGELSLSSSGFFPPEKGNDALVSLDDDIAEFCIKIQEKQLQKKVIEHYLKERENEIIANGGTVSKKERKELREKIIDDLLPRALVVDAFFRFYQYREWLFLDSTSKKSAEFLTLLMRADAIKKIPHSLENQFDRAIKHTLTDWLQNDPTGNFELGDECLLMADGETKPSRVKISNQDLRDSEVMNHVEAGKMVKELDLVWDNRVSFVLNEKLQLKKIHFFNSVFQENPEDEESEKLDNRAQKIIQIKTLTELLNDLVRELGGINGND